MAALTSGSLQKFIIAFDFLTSILSHLNNRRVKSENDE
jgi:hypothetical protein